MGLDRTTLYSGPGKLYRAAAAIFTEGDIDLADELTTVEDKSSMYGRMDEHATDRRIKIGFTPYPTWDYIAALFPAWLTTPAVGTRIYGATDVLADVWAKSGTIYPVLNTAFTKVSDMTLGPGKSLYGAAELTGLIANSKDFGDAAAYLGTIATAADPGGTFDPTNKIQCRWTLAISGLTGFSAVRAVDDWKLACSFSLKPINPEGLTRDMELESVSWMLSGRPVGVTDANVVAAVENNSMKLGGRIGTGYDAVLTSEIGSKTITIHSVGVKKAGFKFGNGVLRPGEIGLVAKQTFDGTSHAPIAQVVFSA